MRSMIRGEPIDILDIMVRIGEDCNPARSTPVDRRFRLYEACQRYADRRPRYALQQRWRDYLSWLGRHEFIARPLLAADALSRPYDVDVVGGDKLPRQGCGLINAVHQDGDDVALMLGIVAAAARRPVSPLVEIDSGQNRLDSIGLEMADVTWALRGEDSFASMRKRELKTEMLRKAVAGRLQMAWSEGTFCPRWDDVLGMFAGSSTQLAVDYYRLTGEKLLNYPAATAYEFDECFKIRAAHVEFLDPFDTIAFMTDHRFTGIHGAADALRGILLTKKTEMYQRFMPGLSAEQYSRFRWASHLRHPGDPDYYDCGHFSLNYRLAIKAGDAHLAAEVLDMFNDSPPLGS